MHTHTHRKPPLSVHQDPNSSKLTSPAGQVLPLLQRAKFFIQLQYAWFCLRECNQILHIARVFTTIERKKPSGFAAPPHTNSAPPERQPLRAGRQRPQGSSTDEAPCHLL
mmetsp:Transcript_13419/g.22040  ORF Transcript_13419/g.22040 Transcript_13419/m.22040 type:complete len:110 (-) Transcript_13419:523-852(-)